MFCDIPITPSQSPIISDDIQWMKKNWIMNIHLNFGRKGDIQILKLNTYMLWFFHLQRINNGENPLLFFKRFLDDIFLVFTGCLQKLHQFLSELNNIHPTIKFTMTHTTPSGVLNPECGCETSESLAFLDTSWR